MRINRGRQNLGQAERASKGAAAADMDVHQAGQFKRQTASSNTRPALEGFSSVSGFGYGAGSDASPAFNSDSSLSSTASRLSPEAMLAMQQAHREQQGSSLSRSWPRPRPNFEKTPSSTRNRPADNDLLLPTGVKMPHFGSLAKIDEDSLQPNSYSAADPDQAGTRSRARASGGVFQGPG